jgi:hypothetical protein
LEDNTTSTTAMISDLIRLCSQQVVEGATLALSQMQAIVLGIPIVKVTLNVLVHAPQVPEILGSF